MDKRKLAELLVEHKEKALGDHAYTPREILAQAGEMAHQKEIHVITGIRRSGKSTLMRLFGQYAQEAGDLRCLGGSGGIQPDRSEDPDCGLGR